MKALKLVKVNNVNVPITPFEVGQVLFAVDSKQVFFDHSNGVRYSDIEDNVIVADSFADFGETNLRYMNKVYIDLFTNRFYKFDFDTLQFKLIYTDDEFIKIIMDGVGLIEGTLDDLENGKEQSPVTLASNVYYSGDGNTTLEEMLKRDLYITQVQSKYVSATTDDQRVFKIPYPVSKYNLFRDHMTVIINDSESNTGGVKHLSAEDYVVNNGYIIIDKDKPGIPINQKVLFMFYYTRTTKINKSQVIDSDNILDGSITLEKLDAGIEIPARLILQTNEAQFVTQEEKEIVQSFKDFQITNLSADVIRENENRKFVDQEMYDFLLALVESGGITDGGEITVTSYVHPKTHNASMILLRDLNIDLEQYSREIENRWANTQTLNTRNINELENISELFTPGNYCINNESVAGLPSGVSKYAKLEIETSNGKVYEALEDEWVTQRIISKDEDDNLRIFYRACGNGRFDYSEWSELITTTTGLEKLETETKDIIGAINEVFQLANDGRSKWQSVIGYPLDNYDTFSNLYEKTRNIKQLFVDKLTNNGVECNMDNTLTELVEQVGVVGVYRSTKKGELTSTNTKIEFTDKDGNTFESYYVESDQLSIDINFVNLYKDNELYAHFKNGKGISNIGSSSMTYVDVLTDKDGSFIGSAFRIPVKESNTKFTFEAVPK